MNLTTIRTIRSAKPIATTSRHQDGRKENISAIILGTSPMPFVNSSNLSKVELLPPDAS